MRGHGARLNNIKFLFKRPELYRNDKPKRCVVCGKALRVNFSKSGMCSIDSNMESSLNYRLQK